MSSTTTTNTRLLLVGCGKMGGALLEGALASRFTFGAIRVIDPAPVSGKLKAARGLKWLSALDQLEPDFGPDLIVIAVKPQQMETVLPSYTRFRESVFLSIAAGTTRARLEKLLGGADYAIVRAMPNLPASIGQGISTLIANAKANPAQRALCESFLKTAGDVVWLEDENLMDAVTALSANGPAYVFALCEAMAKGATVLGLPSDIAMKLARKTVIGSGALLAQSQDTPENLRRSVTSPGGTTEAAFKVLLAENGLSELMAKAIAAGAKRGKELAQ